MKPLTHPRSFAAVCCRLMMASAWGAGGRRLAARALGMSPRKVFSKVILPQLIRVTIPPLSNDFITMLKITSLASVISLQELLARTQSLIASTFRFVEYYSAAAIYYLVL